MAAHYPITAEERLRAEATLLGSLLLHPAAGSAVRDLLQPEYFSEDRHRLIYDAVMAVIDIPEHVTVDTLSILLLKQELESVGGIPYLTGMTQQAENTTVPIEEQAHLLKQATLHSMLGQLGKTLYTRTMRYDFDDLRQVVGDLEKATRFARQLLSPTDRFPPGIGSFPADVDAYVSELESLSRQRVALTGISTGFADLDTITGGLQPSDLIIIAGPPSIGKTSFALSIALHVLLTAHRSVGLFSLEAPKGQVIGRLLSMTANLDQRLLRTLEIDDDHLSHLLEARTALSQANLWIDDTANLSTANLRDKAHFLVERCGVELLIVDYVHLMLSEVNEKRHENRVQEVGEISRSLKALARELSIPVLAVAQVSRAFESRPSKKLQLKDLRDGSLENDADLVLFLSLAETDTARTPAYQLATITVAKHRNGPRADLDVCFHVNSARFLDFQVPAQTPNNERTSLPASVASNRQPGRLPRLVDIMERAARGQTRQENRKSVPDSSSLHRELPRGYVFEDDESTSESEIINAPAVDG